MEVPTPAVGSCERPRDQGSNSITLADERKPVRCTYDIERAPEPLLTRLLFHYRGVSLELGLQM
jgi:hypothetical protein